MFNSGLYQFPDGSITHKERDPRWAYGIHHNPNAYSVFDDDRREETLIVIYDSDPEVFDSNNINVVDMPKNWFLT